MKTLTLIMALALTASATTFECHELVDDLQGVRTPVVTTVTMDSKKATVVNTIGTFTYKYLTVTTSGVVLYAGRSSTEYLGYSKLNTRIIMISDGVYLDTCKALR